ncbi:MAG TPA: hypothetical protein VFV50_16110 [Bdellovibrionales bacterium]|nr:hypothetical protein [Bdellovibrionales bacterium]
MKIKLELVQQLMLDSAVQRGRPGFVTAASGLVLKGGVFYTCADDELHLGVFEAKRESGALHRIFDGELPVATADRKKKKPDLESLTYLPPSQAFRDGALLAVPSGSKPNRMIGKAIPYAGVAPDFAKAFDVDFKDLFAHLASLYRDLNVEGAAVLGETFRLLQRGNGKPAQNATIDLDLNEILSDLAMRRPLAKRAYLKSREHDLGSIGNIKLTFTDCCYGPHARLWFLAAAEDTESTYDDGAFKGAVLGRMDSAGTTTDFHELDIHYKPEGLWVEPDGTFFIVTDADSPRTASRLYKGKL